MRDLENRLRKLEQRTETELERISEEEEEQLVMESDAHIATKMAIAQRRGWVDIPQVIIDMFIPDYKQTEEE